MKVLVFSDSHVPTRCKAFPRQFLEVLPEYDLVICCGDWVSLDAFTEVESLARKLVGVRGNMDDFDLASRLPEVARVSLNGVEAGVLHGYYHSFHPKSLLAPFGDKVPDVIFFGHTHRYLWKKVGNVLFVNPGSLTNPVPGERGGYLHIEVEEGELRGRRVEIG